MDCALHRHPHHPYARSAALMFAALLSACDDAPPPPAADIRITSRPIATIYKIKATDAAQRVQCYQIRDNQLTTLTTLPSDDLVDIVAVEEGLRQHHGELWLHIYPRLTHRPSCYVNVNNLIPYS